MSEPARSFSKILQQRADFENDPLEEGIVVVGGFHYDYSEMAAAESDALKGIVAAIRRYQRRALEDIIEIGLQLERAKEIIVHGKFEKWAKAEFGMSLGSLNEYKNIALRFGGKPSIIEGLTPTTARLLAGPSVPEEVVNEVVEKGVAQGKPLPVSEVRAIKLAHLPPLTIDAAYSVNGQVTEVELPQGYRAVILDLDIWEKLRLAVRANALRAYLSLAEVDVLAQGISEGLVEEVEAPAYSQTGAEEKGLSVDEWLEMMPDDLDLEGVLKLFRVSREHALMLQRTHADLRNAIFNVLDPADKLFALMAKKVGHA